MTSRLTERGIAVIQAQVPPLRINRISLKIVEVSGGCGNYAVKVQGELDFDGVALVRFGEATAFVGDTITLVVDASVPINITDAT